MTEIIGGALLALGGGMQVACAVRLLRRPRRGRDGCPELALAYPVLDAIAAELRELVDRIA